MRKLLFILALLSTPLYGQVTAATCNTSDVQTAITGSIAVYGVQ